jgi:para-aminobenzoate synthetase/4-amino-4-deoxychorismate lyase
MAPATLDPGESFVLLDDARAEGARDARLYRAPTATVIARDAAEVLPALDRIAELARAGHYLAGYIAYEAGLALEPHLAPLAAARTGADGPLVWFGAFAGYQAIPAGDVPPWLAARENPGQHSAIGPLEPQVSIGGYARGFAALREAIVAGDIYQANFTLPLAGSWRGDPLAIYASLRGAASSGYGAVVHDGRDWLLSFSPELFFSLRGDNVLTRPMKGTRPRGATRADDEAEAHDLATSPKDRAENLMIVDLLRNDLSRVAQPGSVRVADAFAVETYPTLHQMVTTIRARLTQEHGAAELLRALFPCGSVTGAPKIRAMELIAAHERDPRGAYCGAIGRFDPPHANGAGEAAFNVAIRTLRLTGGEAGVGRAVMGVGSALVADSACLPEWRESLSKGGFVRQPAQEPAALGVPSAARFDLMETMRCSPDGGMALLDRHLERLSASASELGFACDGEALRQAILKLCVDAKTDAKLRLMLARSGAYLVEITDMPPALAQPVPCVVLPLPVDPGDWRLRHKCSDRSFYEAGLRAAHANGAQEALFIRDDGLLTEGCFSTIFVPRDGVWLTPPTSLGLLPGVLRAAMLGDGRAREAELRLDDLADGFAIGNALRGLIPARLLEPAETDD